MRDIMFIIKANEGISEKKVDTLETGQQLELNTSIVGTYSYMFSDNIWFTKEKKTFDGICS